MVTMVITNTLKECELVIEIKRILEKKNHKDKPNGNFNTE